MKCSKCNMPTQEYRNMLLCINCNNIEEKPNE
jgi:hypothetical protein